MDKHHRLWGIYLTFVFTIIIIDDDDDNDDVDVCGRVRGDDDPLDYDCSMVDDLLDEKIVQTSWKRSVYPKKILPYFVRSLKAERKLLVCLLTFLRRWNNSQSLDL